MRKIASAEEPIVVGTEKQLFIDDQKPSQASVVLEPIGGRPTNAQVKAAVHVVSSFGGANLSSKNIAVSTSDGTILQSPSEASQDHRSCV